MEKRITYFDFLRGIAILMVVGIHTFPTSSFESVDGNIAIIVRQILNCAVPIFLAISGFFLVKKDLQSSKTRVAFWRKQIPSVYVPCLLWSLPLFVLALWEGEYSLWLNIARLLFCGFSIYYFVILIMQCYVLLPYIQKLRRGVTLCISAFLALVYVALCIYILNIKGYRLPTTLYGGPFPLLIIYFVLGMYLGQRNRNYGLLVPVLGICSGLVLEYFESRFLFGFHGLGLGSIKLSAYLYSSAVIVFLFSKRIEQVYEKYAGYLQGVVRLGNISFGVYLTHCYVIKFVRWSTNDLCWGAEWAIVLVVTSGVILLVKSLIPNIAVKYLGFR